MKISVVTVTYNAALVIEGALQSLRGQTHPDVELIIVDGQSADDTVARVREFADLWPLVHVGPDAGIYEAMNKGIELARGDALFFLNADDRLAHRDALASLDAALMSDAAAGIAYGDVIVKGADRDVWRSHATWSATRLGFEPLCHQATLARRSVFERVGPFDTTYRISADMDWFTRCEAAGVRFVHVPRVVSWYAEGGESDRRALLRRAENELIRRRYFGPATVFHQRVRAALRRRALRLADWLA